MTVVCSDAYSEVTSVLRSPAIGFALRLPLDAAMPVDVETAIEIQRSRAEVAAYAADPTNAVAWYENIKRVEWITPPPLGEGSSVAFEARFLGRQLVYTYEVAEYAPGERLVMRTASGPFAMETTYTWEDTPTGGARMTLRNRGEPAGFSRFATPLMRSAIRRANRKDLRRLRDILEQTRLSTRRP